MPVGDLGAHVAAGLAALAVADDGASGARHGRSSCTTSAGLKRSNDTVRRNRVAWGRALTGAAQNPTSASRPVRSSFAVTTTATAVQHGASRQSTYSVSRWARYPARRMRRDPGGRLQDKDAAKDRVGHKSESVYGNGASSLSPSASSRSVQPRRSRTMGSCGVGRRASGILRRPRAERSALLGKTEE